jgi:peroxiredoxin
MRSVFVFFCLLFCSVYHALGSAIVSCHAKGSPEGDRFIVRVAHQFLDGKADNYEMSTDAEGKFVCQINLNEPQYVTVQHQSDVLMVYMEPDDALEISMSIFEFPMKVNFAGRGGENNRFLFDYLRTFPTNFNEFTKVRYKIAQYWCTIDTELDEKMKANSEAAFIAYVSDRSKKHLSLLDAFQAANPKALSYDFVQFISSEVLYREAYDLLVYGNVYKNWHNLTENVFDAAQNIPIESNLIGGENYRRFLMAFMAHRFKKTGKDQQPAVHQYLDAGQTLTNKPRAFFQSEVIYTALKEERYAEIMPYYSSFLKDNTYDIFEEKVTSVYERVAPFTLGVYAPDFTGIDHNGFEVLSKNLRGKVVYLNFWASYCGSCLKKIDYMSTQYKELQNQNIEVINVSIEKNKAKWQEDLLAYHVLGVNVLNGSENTTDMAKAFGVEAIPQYFIIDKNGMFVQKPTDQEPSKLVKYLLTQTNQ